MPEGINTKGDGMSDVERVKLLIDGIDYRADLPVEAIELCKKSGIYIIYGASDDLLEVDGLHREEFGAYDGFDSADVEYEPDGGNINFVVKALKDNFVVAVWCPNPEVSWAMECTPCKEADTESFEMIEDGEVFCQGLILKYPL